MRLQQDREERQTDIHCTACGRPHGDIREPEGRQHVRAVPEAHVPGDTHYNWHCTRLRRHDVRLHHRRLSESHHGQVRR